MGIVTVNDSTLTDIADAIRDKLEVETTYKPSEMADAIESISGGGITPTGTIEITQNGVVDVTNYASADVNVECSSGTDWNGFCNGTWPTGTITLDSTVTSIIERRFCELYGITGLSAPYVTTIAAYAFLNCEDLTSINFPELTTLSGTYAFSGCDSLEVIYLPKLTNIKGYTFNSSASSARKTIVLPSVTSLDGEAFRGAICDAVDLGTGLTALGNRSFYGHNTVSNQYSAVILRCTSQVVTATSSTYVSKINSNTTVYVPSALLSSYTSDSVWSGTGATFMAIEGTAYETAYADGTPIT